MEEGEEISRTSKNNWCVICWGIPTATPVSQRNAICDEAQYCSYAEVLQAELAAHGSSPAAGLIQTVEGGVVTKRSSRIAGMNRKDTEGEPVGRE